MVLLAMGDLAPWHIQLHGYLTLVPKPLSRFNDGWFNHVAVLETINRALPTESSGAEEFVKMEPMEMNYAQAYRQLSIEHRSAPSTNEYKFNIDDPQKPFNQPVLSIECSRFNSRFGMDCVIGLNTSESGFVSVYRILHQMAR